MADTLLDVIDLCVRIPGREGPLDPVRGVSFALARGETLGIVGESGSGKSLTALALMQLISPDGGAARHEIRGRALFRDDTDSPVDLLSADRNTMQSIRGRRISMVFQDPMTTLNPVMRVGMQIAEAMLVHEDIDLAAATRRTTEVLRQVGIPEPEERARLYPHELSGGMRQRVTIAMALVCRPALLIADEPTTALDVTVQAELLRLLKRLQAETGMALLFISHDLAAVAHIADRVAVMYAGRIVEEAPAADLFTGARHPYTRGLLRSIPDPFGAPRALEPIPGAAPLLSRVPSGCAFHPRCDAAIPSRCHIDMPELESDGARGRVRCWNWRQALNRGVVQ